jgi:hypothetical protein
MKGQSFEEIKNMDIHEALLREAGFESLDFSLPENSDKWNVIKALAKQAVAAGLLKKTSTVTSEGPHKCHKPNTN